MTLETARLAIPTCVSPDASETLCQPGFFSMHNQIIELRKKKFGNTEIAKILGVSLHRVKVITRQLIKDGLVVKKTHGICKELAQKQETVLRKIIFHRKQGLSWRQIGIVIGKSFASVRRAVCKMIKEGRLDYTDHHLYRSRLTPEVLRQRIELILPLAKACKPYKVMVKKTGLTVAQISHIVQKLEQCGRLPKRIFTLTKNGLIVRFEQDKAVS